MTRGKAALLAVLVAGLGVALSSNGTEPRANMGSRPYRHFDWLGVGGCRVPVIGMPTDFNRVAGSIPRKRRANVVTSGAGEARQAVLIFVLLTCPDNSLVKAKSEYFRRRSVDQAMVGVLYGSAREDDADKMQFYLLSSTVDWRRFARAERGIGLPTEFQRALRVEVSHGPLGGLGTFKTRAPRGRAPFTASGSVVALNPIRELDLDSAHFYDGRFGLVRVHHDETWAPGNAVVGTVSAPAESRVSRWMGATRRDAQGIYFWDHHERHAHRYGVVQD